MEVKVIIIISILAVITVFCLIYLARVGKTDKPVLINESLFNLFDPNNILKIDFIRNKIVVTFTDASLFDVTKLQEYGGKGISVIGDKIKFFISDNIQDNENLYKSLLEHIER